MIRVRIAPLALVLLLPGCRPAAEQPVPRPEPVASAPAATPETPPAPLPPPPASAPPPPTTAGARAEIVPPVALESPAPDWSRLPGGRPAGPGGDFALRIDEAGVVTDVSVVRAGDPAADALVIETLRRWRFQPATRDGTAIAVRWQVSLNVER